LTSKTALARAAGDPYDANRLEIFQALFEEMNDWPATSRQDAVTSGQVFQNAGFFDAYFSNFIEGTEFEVDEAIDIAFHNKIPSARPEDAHDLLGTFRIVANTGEMAKSVSGLSTTEFLDLLRSWHHTIMQGRPDKHPGDFKEIPNQAGRTLFVDPALTVGTLRRGFELSRGIHTPFGRAVFLMFMISEVHPFDDGNGRLARAVCNAELVSHNERRIIIPTVFRVEYIDSLRLLSREKLPRTFARMADQAQEFTADVDFSELAEARSQLDAWHAFDTDTDSRLRRPRR
jgi:fido (protein-threonine AMPylation protein)